MVFSESAVVVLAPSSATLFQNRCRAKLHPDIVDFLPFHFEILEGKR